MVIFMSVQAMLITSSSGAYNSSILHGAINSFRFRMLQPASEFGKVGQCLIGVCTGGY